MKEIIPIIIALVINFSSIAQDIPNNGFDNWYTASQGHLDPESWSTANSTTNVFPIFKITTERTEDAFEGQYAAKLTSKTVLTFVAPGFVTLGDFDIDLFTQVVSLTGGLDYSLRPAKLKLWYKFAPVSGDNFRIGLWMLRNEGFEVPDTVATALFESNEPKSIFTQLIVDLEYRNEFNPEQLNIMAVSSNPDNPIAGSVLIIDKVELEYVTNITPYNLSQSLFFPNPANETITINEYFIGSEYTIFDMAGKELSRTQIKKSTVELSELKSGNYIIQINKAGIIHSQKLVKI